MKIVVKSGEIVPADGQLLTDATLDKSALTRVVSTLKIAKITLSRALQAAMAGMGLSIVGMLIASTGHITASEGAFLQEGIDVAAIMWALTVLVSYRDKNVFQSTFINK